MALRAVERAAIGVAPGQARVVYDGTRVLGGGWIARGSGASAAHNLRRAGAAAQAPVGAG